jgi:hypothetical protein
MHYFKLTIADDNGLHKRPMTNLINAVSTIKDHSGKVLLAVQSGVVVGDTFIPEENSEPVCCKFDGQPDDWRLMYCGFESFQLPGVDFYLCFTDDLLQESIAVFQSAIDEIYFKCQYVRGADLPSKIIDAFCQASDPKGLNECFVEKLPEHLAKMYRNSLI